MPEGELRRKQTITLPSEVTELEEANLPSDLATALSGKEVTVELVWERKSSLRPAEPWDEELLIDPAGKYWSECSPLQVFFKEESGKIWRFPRRWVPGIRVVAPIRAYTGFALSCRNPTNPDGVNTFAHLLGLARNQHTLPIG